MIETKIGSHSILFTWTKEIPCLKGNHLIIEYDVDISNTPRHLANFMFSLIMSEAITRRTGTILFDELTQKELECVRNYNEMNFISKGCSGLGYGYNKLYPHQLSINVEAKKTVEDNTMEHGGPTLCANGLGKDGLLIANLTKETEGNMRCFFVEGQMEPSVLRERMNNVNKFYKEHSIESNIIKGNYCDIQPTTQGFYPYYHALPLAYYYNSEAILSGLSIHMNKTRVSDMALVCPGESIFGFDYISKASGISFSSPNRPLSLPAVELLLAERYPKSIKYQRSCIKANPWCGQCGKCLRHHIYLKAAGIDPTTIGLASKNIEEQYTGAYGTQSRYGAEVSGCLNKLRGEPYDEWVFGASEPVFDLIWGGKELKKIFQEHLELYSYDIGTHGEGWMLEPSKWKDWLKKGYIETRRERFR